MNLKFFTNFPLYEYYKTNSCFRQQFIVRGVKQLSLLTIAGLLVPFLGTSLGASCVFLMKKNIHNNAQNALLGFASGVMTAASVWSLILPAMDMCENFGRLKFIPVVLGIVLGIILLDVIDKIADIIKTKTNREKKSTNMLLLAVTIHNIPEGMAVGVVFAAALKSSDAVSLAGAIALAIGIAIQNFPEGAIISLPLASDGKSKPKAFWYGVLSGAVEPVFAIITILLTSIVVPALPYLLCLAAGAMIYVVISELIPQACENGNSKFVAYTFVVGFLIMLMADVALG